MEQVAASQTHLRVNVVKVLKGAWVSWSFLAKSIKTRNAEALDILGIFTERTVRLWDSKGGTKLLRHTSKPSNSSNSSLVLCAMRPIVSLFWSCLLSSFARQSLRRPWSISSAWLCLLIACMLTCVKDLEKELGALGAKFPMRCILTFSQKAASRHCTLHLRRQGRTLFSDDTWIFFGLEYGVSRARKCQKD